MTRESFDEAKRLLDKIATYKNKLSNISRMIEDSNKTDFSDEEVFVSIYNGKSRSHSAPIYMTLVKNMLVGAKEHYESLIDKCESDISAL